MPTYQTIASDKANNDVFLDEFGNLAMRDDAEALANVILNRQQTASGELQYNINGGIPYFSTVFSSPPDLQMFEAFLREDAISVPEVERVTAFSVDVSGGTLTYKMELSTIYGGITVNG